MSDKPFVRVGDKPLLTPDSLPFGANCVFNPGAVEIGGEVLLLLRIEDKRGISHIRVARSANGVDHWKIDDTQLLEPDLPEHPYEEWGCEDARVTRIGPDKYIIAYTAYSRYGPAVALATTADFVSVKRIGAVLAPTNKDAAIFPEIFDGNAIMLHRPVTGGYEHIWYTMSKCDDYTHWCLPGVVMPQRGGPWWDGLRVGVGAPPIKTEQGWLMIYHGVKEMAGNPIYRLGLGLLDLEDPKKPVARASDWVFGPEAEFEQRGLIPNVVYTCGAIPRGDEIWMYYGAADTVVGLAVAKTRDLLDFVWEHDYLHIVGPAKGVAK